MAAFTTSACGEFPSGCPLFPVDNISNTRIDLLQPLANSDDLVDSIGAEAGLHPDFGPGLYEVGPIGIPFVTVPADQPPQPVRIGVYGDESDPGPFPIPADAPTEGGNCSQDGDRTAMKQYGMILADNGSDWFLSGAPDER